MPTKDEGRRESERRVRERGRRQESNAAIKSENQNNQKRSDPLRGLQPQENRGAAKQNAVHECPAGKRLAQTQLSSRDRAEREARWTGGKAAGSRMFWGEAVGVNQWRRGEEETSEVEWRIENHEVESRRIGSRKSSRKSSRLAIGLERPESSGRAQ